MYGIFMVIIVLVLLGLCAGSFINAFAWRLRNKKDWVKGRSVCVHCKHQLATVDLIPILSWLWLRAKCRYCKKPISDQYPLVEALTAALFLLSYAYWPDSLLGAEQIVLFVLWLIFLVGLISLAIYDMKWLVLPNKIIFPLIGLALAQSLYSVAVSSNKTWQFWQIGFGFLIGFGLFYVIFQISAGKWIGGGDVKLGGLLGLILAAPDLTLLMIFLASLFGTLFSVPLLATGRVSKSSKVPFGPFLILAAIVTKLFGASVIAWYNGKLLI